MRAVLRRGAGTRRSPGASRSPRSTPSAARWRRRRPRRRRPSRANCSISSRVPTCAADRHRHAQQPARAGARRHLPGAVRRTGPVRADDPRQRRRSVWFKPIPNGRAGGRPARSDYEGRPVLTWWQDPLVAGGRRDAAVVIADSSYRDDHDRARRQRLPARPARVRNHPARARRCSRSMTRSAATSAPTAVRPTAPSPTRCFRRSTCAPAWSATSGTRSTMSPSPTPTSRWGTAARPVSPWDYFHINAVSEHGGDLLVDSRNTWAAYDVDPRTGRIAWRLGGKHSSFAMGPGAAPGLAARRPRRARRHDLVLRQRRHAARCTRSRA